MPSEVVEWGYQMKAVCARAAEIDFASKLIPDW